MLYMQFSIITRCVCNLAGAEHLPLNMRFMNVFVIIGFGTVASSILKQPVVVESVHVAGCGMTPLRSAPVDSPLRNPGPAEVCI